MKVYDMRSIVEEYKVSKIRMQWMLINSADIRICEVKPLLRTKRKFKAQNEIDKSVSGNVRSYSGRHSIMCSQIANRCSTMVDIHGDTIRS